MNKVAVVTGSNKGIGLAIIKGLCQRFNGTVYLTSRDEKRGREAVAELNKIGLNPSFVQLDVCDKSSIANFRDHLVQNHGGIDILINNAAITETYRFPAGFDECKNVIDTNFTSVLFIEEIIYPIVRNGGRILNISSICGHLSNIKNKYWINRLSNKDLVIDDLIEFVDWFLESKKNGTFKSEDISDGGTVAAYRISKVALSALTFIQQRKLESTNIAVNSLHPGLVRTDMTRGVGFYSADQAAETPIYLALDAPQSLKGAFVWYDKKVLDWYDYEADYYFKSSVLNAPNMLSV